MKNVIKSFAALAASLLAFNACNHEALPEGTSETHSLSFVAEAPQTKTSVSKENGEAIYSWSSGDENRFSVYEIVDGSYSKATSVEATKVADQMKITAKFSGAAHAGAQYFALLNTGVQASQNATNTSYDQLSDVLISEVVTSSNIEDETLVLCFKRETAFALMTAKGLEGDYMLGTSVIADKVIAAEYDYKNKDFYAEGSRTITVSDNGDPISMIEDGNSPIFFATVPVEDATLKVAVVTGDENGDFQAAYEKSFAAGKSISFTRGDVHAFGIGLADNEVTSLTLNLATDETTTASENEISWVRSFVSILDEKGDATTNTNNYYPGTSGQNYKSTRFYKGSNLTITPLLGAEIKSITFTATSNDYAAALAGSTWSANAYLGVDGTTVTLIPTAKGALVAEIGGTCGFTSIVIELGQPNIAHASGVTLDQTSLSIEVEDTETLVATVTPDDAINKSVTWESSNDEVATVTNGVVRGISEGDATITVRTVDGGHTATCEVHVTSTSGKVYKWVKVSTLADLEDGGRYYLATNNGEKIFNGTISSSGHLQVGTMAAVYDNGKLTTIPEDAMPIELTATSTANQYYIMYDGGYLHATAASSGNFSKVDASNFNSSTTNAWTFSVSDGKYDAVGSIKTAKIRSYNNATFRSYASTASNGDSFVLYKRINDQPTCAAPTLTSGTAGEVNIGTVVYLTNNEAGSTIRYTVDSSDPTSSSTEYTVAGITINDDCTIKAAAFKANYNASPVLTLNYTVPVVSNPTIAFDETTVNITCATDGATIYYVIGGDDVEDPTTSSAVYNSASKPSVEDGQTVKAFAVKSGAKNSLVVSLKYTSAPPVLNVVTVSGAPSKKEYKAGDKFDPAGLIVTGTYSDNHQETITEGITWSEPAALTAGQTSVSITATVSGVTSAAYNVTGLTVNAAGPSAGTVLFHETFGDNSGSARNWDNSYSVKSGLASVYSGITSYTVSNVKQGKNTTGSTGSGLNQSSSGTDAYIIVGPLKVDNCANMQVTYQWKAASTKGTYTTKLYYATSSTGSYTEVTGGTGTGATTFVERKYSLPAAAQVSTLYLKVVWNTSNTQAIIDELELKIKD